MEFKAPSQTSAMRSVETATRRLSGLRIRRSLQEEGIIESVMVVNRVLYVIARRVKSSMTTDTDHSYQSLFNNDRHVREEALSPFELLIPVSNIDLAVTTVKPEELLGKYVSVSVLKGRAVKAEYIGDLSGPSQSPLQLARAALENARSLAGVATRIEENEKARDFLKTQYNLTDDQLTLIGMSLEEFKGKVIKVEGDATYDRDTANKLEHEVIIESHDLIANTNKEPMKTKNCHLPVTIFSAR